MSLYLFFKSTTRRLTESALTDSLIKKEPLDVDLWLVTEDKTFEITVGLVNESIGEKT